jgi:hypothetical protein
MKFATRFVVLCLGIIFVSPGFYSAQQTAASLSGTWSGRATQQGAKAFNVTVILDGSGSGFIEYPNKKCGGTLRFVRKNGDTLSYQETITHGKTTCAQNGRVDLLSDGNTLAWTWSAGADKATATLAETEVGGSSGCSDCDLNYDNSIQACYPIANSGDQQRCQDRADDDARTCHASCKN